MKLNIDVGYILKRLIVIGLGFILISQLKSCDVHAANINVTYSGVYTYEQTSNTNSNVTNSLSTITSGTAVWYRVPKERYRLRLLATAGLVSESGTYDVIFSTFNEDRAVFSGYLQVGYDEFSCESFYDLYVSYPSTSGASQTDLSSGSQTWICRDVSILNTQAFNIFLFGNVGATTNHYVYITQRINWVKKESISSAINQQSQQQHQDAQNTQNAINDVNDSINDQSSSQSQNTGNSIFDVDENGQPTNSDVTHFGLEGIITAPLIILQRAQQQCQNVSFPLFGKTITLPCGDSLFWSRDFSNYTSIFSSGVSDLNSTRDNFRVFWNALFGGAILFHLLLKLYQVIQEAVDPMSDNYESISSAIETKSPTMNSFEEVDMSNVQRNLNMRSIKQQSKNEAVVLGSVK